MVLDRRRQVPSGRSELNSKITGKGSYQETRNVTALKIIAQTEFVHKQKRQSIIKHYFTGV